MMNKKVDFGFRKLIYKGKDLGKGNEPTRVGVLYVCEKELKRLEKKGIKITSR